MSFQKEKENQSNHIYMSGYYFRFQCIHTHTHTQYLHATNLSKQFRISSVTLAIILSFVFFSFGTLELHGVTSSVRLNQRKTRRWDTNKENKTKFDSNLWKVIPLVFRTWRTNDLSTFKKTPRDIFTVYVWTSSETFSRVYSFQLQLLI